MDTNLTLVAGLLLAVGGWAWWMRRARTDLEDEEQPPRRRRRAWVAGEPGRAALDAALERVHPDTRVRRWEVDADGDPALVEVVAYLVLIPTPHWHFVTFGLSEIGDKLSDDDARSGLGIELTARVASDDEPARWPVDLLCALAARAKRDGAFTDGASVALTAGDVDGLPTSIAGVLFTGERALRVVSTSNGTVALLQALPLGEDEHARAAAGGGDEVLTAMRARDPALVWPE
jgi:hypothetical protein